METKKELTKRMKNKLTVVKILSLTVAILGVLAHRELPSPWQILCWVPITLGYGFYFSGILEKIQKEVKNNGNKKMF